MADDHRPVRVAQYNLRSHIYELIDEKQTALKHFLMNEHASFRLRSHHKHHAEQVGCQSRPRSVGNGHNGAVDERFYLITVLRRHVDVVSPLLELDAQTAETLGNNAQILVRYIFYGDFAAGHRRHTDKASHLDHIRQYPVFGSVQFLDRKSTRLNSSHANISYAVFCLKKKKK